MLKESFVFMFISSFMALFPVANPVGTGFIINGFLSGLDRSERRSIVRRIAVNYLLIGIGSLESRVFYPITFPISIGPGSISVIFTLMASVNIKDGLGKIIINYAVIAFVIFLMCLILYVILSQGQKITKKVGVTGTMIINKMVAFFTFCVGIQIIAEGVEKIFHLSLS